MSKNLKHIFDSSSCVNSDVLKNYVLGKLSSAENNTVEKHIVDCEMCSDELEGLMLIENIDNLDNTIKELNIRIDKKVEEKKDESKKRILPWIIRISAAVIILLAISTIVYVDNYSDNSEQIVENTNIETPKKETNKQDEGIVSMSSDIEVLDKVNDRVQSGKQKELSQVVEENEEIDIKSSERYWNGDGESGEKLKTKNDITVNNTTYAYDANTEAENNNLVLDPVEEDVDDFSKDYKANEQEIVIADLEVAAEAQNNRHEDLYRIVAAEEVESNKKPLFGRKKTETRASYKADKTKVAKGYVSTNTSSETLSDFANAPVSTSKIVIDSISNGLDFDTDISESKDEITTIALGGALAEKEAVDSFTEAHNLFISKDYDSSLKLLENILKDDPQHYKSLYYSARIYLIKDIYGKALTNFDKVLMIKEGELFEHALWFKAITMIRDDNPDFAKVILNNIIEDKGYYLEKAIDLRSKLD